MSTPASLSIPQQYRAAFTLIGKLYSRKNMPDSIETSREHFETLNHEFGQHGQEWLRAIAPASTTKAAAKAKGGTKATAKKTKKAGA